MRPRDAVRHAAGYHLRALPPTLAGLAIAAAGVWYGVGGGSGVGTGFSAATLTASGRLAPTVALVLVGTAVAAVGRTAVRIEATAAAVAEAVGESDDGLNEDDLRETVAIATDRAVAASFDGAAAEIEARVVDAVDRAASDAGPAPDARAGSDSDDAVPRADSLGAFAASDPAETDPLADATRRASERVESYLADGERTGDAGAFRALAEGAAVLDGEGDEAEGAAADGAEILDGDHPAAGPPDGTERGDDAVIIDGDGGGSNADGDGNEMVFGGDVRDPEGDAA